MQAQAHLRMQRYQNQSLEGGGAGGVAGGENFSEESENETIYERVCMMETSVLLQSEELNRAKTIFLQANSELQSKLENAQLEIDDKIAEIRKKDNIIQDLQSQLTILKSMLKTQGEQLRLANDLRNISTQFSSQPQSSLSSARSQEGELRSESQLLRVQNAEHFEINQGVVFGTAAQLSPMPPPAPPSMPPPESPHPFIVCTKKFTNDSTALNIGNQVNR